MKKRLIIAIVILVLALVGFITCKKISSKNNNEPSSNQENIDTINYFKINLSLADKKQGDEITHKLNDNYTIKLVFKDDINKSFDIYVNDTYILNDYSWEEYINFYTLSNSLIYLNSGFTDVRCEAIYVINNTTVNEIYELDKTKGMVPYEIKINKDNIVVKGTRLSHGPSIVYGKSETQDALLYDNSTWPAYGITENTIVEAIYTFEVKNNKLNLTPVITEQISLKDYLENEKDN